MSGTTLACFISDHGFGHASRALAVLAELREHRSDLHFRIFSSVPYWFLAENLDPQIFDQHEIVVDVGLAQTDPFQHDLGATLNRLDEFLPFREITLNPIVEILRQTGCTAALCDISPLGIAAAKAAGIPAILLENFTWDWMYEEYLDEYPAFSRAIETLRAVYAQADLRLQTEPVCNPLSEAVQIPPIARPFRISRKETRTCLKVATEESLVLLTTGGIQGDFAILDHLRSRPDVCFLLSGSSETSGREGNLIHLPHKSGYHYPDLVRASDAVTGKAGYGTVAEVQAAGIPFARVMREKFRESPILCSYLDRQVSGFALSDAEFASASWLERLNELLAFPRKDGLQPDGVVQAAKQIYSFLN